MARISDETANIVEQGFNDVTNTHYWSSYNWEAHEFGRYLNQNAHKLQIDELAKGRGSIWKMGSQAWKLVYKKGGKFLFDRIG